MGAAQRDGELVADLAAERSGLGECQMMGIARGLLAHQAGLPADKRQVRLAALAGRFLGMGEPVSFGHRQSWLQRGLGVRSGRRLRPFGCCRLVGQAGCGTRGVLKLVW